MFKTAGLNLLCEINLNKLEINCSYAYFSFLTGTGCFVKKESKIKVAYRYALALYEAAAGKKAVDKVMKDAGVLRKIISEDASIVTSLSNPLWNTADKKQTLDEISTRLKLNEETRNFLSVAADGNRLGLLESILKSFCDIYYEKHDIAEVNVETVKPLSTEQDKKLQENLEKYFKKKVLITYTVKPEILGGLVVTCGSDMIDDSIRGKLNRLETVMKGGE